MSPYFAEKKGFSPIFMNEDDGPKVVMSGSVLNHAKVGDCVWGSGFANSYDVVADGLDIRAVRGPLTAQKVADRGYPSPVIGDAGLAIAYVYNPQVFDKRASVAVVPHYVDYAKLRRHFSGAEGVKVVDVLQPVEKVVDEIFNADRVLSSSLHGLVVAAAYDIPFAWLHGSNKIGGDGFKYRDFLLACQCQVYSVSAVSVFRNEIYQKARLINSAEEVWLACPLHDEKTMERYQ